MRVTVSRGLKEFVRLGALGVNDEGVIDSETSLRLREGVPVVVGEWLRGVRVRLPAVAVERVHVNVIVKVGVQLDESPRLRDALADAVTLERVAREQEGLSDGTEQLGLLLGEGDWLLV